MLKTIIGTSNNNRYSKDRPNSEEVEDPLLLPVDGGCSMLTKEEY